ncbi:MAG: penicillin-binding protein, partial [Proteiniphilum sp.]|nr:penicillin-binding protein [Proteiniphilum sp.]
MAKKKTTGSKTPKGKTRTPKQKIVRAMWALFGLAVAFLILLFALISVGAVGYLPQINELENPIDKYASQVISTDNELLFTYSQSDDNRIFVDYSDLSPYLIDAL